MSLGTNAFLTFSKFIKYYEYSLVSWAASIPLQVKRFLPAGCVKIRVRAKKSMEKGAVVLSKRGKSSVVEYKDT